MKKDLSIKQTYDDFVSKTFLTDIEKEVLERYIKDESIVKIAEDILQSTSTVSRTIRELKRKYINYKNLEIAKLMIFQKNK